MCVYRYTFLFKYQNLFYFSVHKFNVQPFQCLQHIFLFLSPSFSHSRLSTLVSVNLDFIKQQPVSQSASQKKQIQTPYFMQQFKQVRFEYRLARKSRVQLTNLESIRGAWMKEKGKIEPKRNEKKNGRNYHKMISCMVVYVRKHILSNLFFPYFMFISLLSALSSSSFASAGLMNAWIFFLSICVLFFFAAC